MSMSSMSSMSMRLSVSVVCSWCWTICCFDLDLLDLCCKSFLSDQCISSCLFRVVQITRLTLRWRRRPPQARPPSASQSKKFERRTQRTLCSESKSTCRNTRWSWPSVWRPSPESWLCTAICQCKRRQLTCSETTQFRHRPSRCRTNHSCRLSFHYWRKWSTWSCPARSPSKKLSSRPLRHSVRRRSCSRARRLWWSSTPAYWCSSCCTCRRGRWLLCCRRYNRQRRSRKELWQPGKPQTTMNTAWLAKDTAMRLCTRQDTARVKMASQFAARTIKG